MKGILIQQKVFKAIDGKYPKNTSEEKILENDEYAHSSIILNLSDSVIRKVGKQNSAKELWDRLENLYTETSLPSKLFLLEKFFRYKLDLSKNIEENIDDFTKLIQDIKLTGDKNIDGYTPIVLLNAIPDAYSYVKAAIQYGRDNVNLDTVINGLKSKEMDLKTNKSSQSNNEVNSVRGRTKNRNSDYKYRKHSRGKSRSKSRTRNDKNHDDKTKERRCYNCGIKGHYIKDCRKPGRDNRDKSHNKEDVNSVTENSSEVFMLCDVKNVNSLNMHEWLLDSGCTFHLSPFKEIFTNFESGNFGFVSMANEKQCEIREEEGLEGRWEKGVMKIMKGSLTVFKAERKRNLYICSVDYDILAASVINDDITSLWHKRLGHISQKGLEIFKKEGVLVDNIEKLKFCDECVLGKQHKVHFPVSPYPNPSSSSSILDYVHADVWGPSNTPTHGGNKYFLSIINNYSRKVFVFLMKNKSDVFEKFRNWKVFVENQTGKRLKALRTDNGLEFCNQSFSDLCNDYGIKRHKTNPYTPQQNGVAECMNRTLLDKVQCMLISSGLPKSFWEKALLTDAYLVNRSPSVPLYGKIPESVWTGKNAEISCLCVFGCSAFVHQNIDKLEPRSQKCIFIGYPEGVKGYRLWLRSQPGFKVLISKDVVFNESEMPCLNNQKEEKSDIETTFNKVESFTEDNQQGGELDGNTDPNRQISENIDSDNNLNNYQLARGRNRRQHKLPSKFNDFHVALNTEGSEPNTVEEALKSENSKQWLCAMNEEMKSLKDNNTWVLVPKPKSGSIVDFK
ncbi:UNVERIFIED_CONTAM: Retrovirus-related Pol polyprotein from transposon TNT 1-94 [Sesamum radiatum]|uniref:Retrovirus-related Pol polyprotein from transposon TNT 1-94 n=1 Tax=Sesamum radiatum TaxID=300843 RepID=A0AAW2L4V5_SESRA